MCAHTHLTNTLSWSANTTEQLQQAHGLKTQNPQGLKNTVKTLTCDTTAV